MPSKETEREVIAKVIRKLRKKLIPALPGMQKVINTRIRNRAYKLGAYLYKRIHAIFNQPCECCYDKHASELYCAEVYNSAFDENPSEHFFCSEECRDYFETSGDYQWCNFCNRYVVESVGYNPHFREVDGEYMCLQCYETEALKNGLEIEREKLETGKLPGMFFNPTDLEENHYYKIRDYMKVRNSEHSKKIAKSILTLLDKNIKVLIEYEKLSIIGNEGYISIWVRLKKNVRKADNTLLIA